MIAMTVKLLALIRLAPPNAAPTPMLTCASAPGTSALPCSLGRRLAHPNLCIADHPSQPFPAPPPTPHLGGRPPLIPLPGASPQSPAFQRPPLIILRPAAHPLPLPSPSAARQFPTISITLIYASCPLPCHPPATPPAPFLIRLISSVPRPSELPCAAAAVPLCPSAARQLPPIILLLRLLPPPRLRALPYTSHLLVPRVAKLGPGRSSPSSTVESGDSLTQEAYLS